MEELKDKLNRLERVFTPDLMKTLDEVDLELGLLQPSVSILKCGVHSDALLVVSGMRDYSNYLRQLIDMTKAALEIARENETQEKENNE